MPLSNTDEEDEDRIREIQLRHLGLKPLCCSIFSKYSQETVSKVFVMSSLNNNAGVFVLWYALARFLTYKKLSLMHRRLMKALCEFEIRESIFLASRHARIFAMSFAKECIRLIGLKSFNLV